MKLQQVKDAAAAIARGINATLPDLFTVGGVAMIGYGAWLIYQPAGFIAAGTCLFGVKVIGVLRGGSK